LLSGPRAKINKKGHAQLRFEAIDTLETHVAGAHHQPWREASGALAYTLEQLGITDVVWNAARSRVESSRDGSLGFIAARLVEKHGRPVSFVFAGKPPMEDGSAVFLDEALARKSINYKLAALGHAYPTYYTGLFSDLREAFTAAVRSARGNSRGLWPMDLTEKGIAVTGLEGLMAKGVILPKFFRRIVTHWLAVGSLAGFREWLAANPERVFILSTKHFTHFDNVIEVHGSRVSVTVPPEDLIFSE
jgi:hypothetical protein